MRIYILGYLFIGFSPLASLHYGWTGPSVWMFIFVSNLLCWIMRVEKYALTGRHR